MTIFQNSTALHRGIMLRAAWHWDGESSAANNPLKAPGSTLVQVCLQTARGTAGDDCYFPFNCGTHMGKTGNKNLSNTGALLYRGTCSVSHPNSGQASLANHPKELVFPANLVIMGIQHLKQPGRLA